MCALTKRGNIPVQKWCDIPCLARQSTSDTQCERQHYVSSLHAFLSWQRKWLSGTMSNSSEMSSDSGCRSLVYFARNSKIITTGQISLQPRNIRNLLRNRFWVICGKECIFSCREKTRELCDDFFWSRFNTCSYANAQAMLFTFVSGKRLTSTCKPASKWHLYRVTIKSQGRMQLT